MSINYLLNYLIIIIMKIFYIIKKNNIENIINEIHGNYS